MTDMAKIKKTVWFYQCERCGHEWPPKTEAEPTWCPKCKSPYWNRPRKEKIASSRKGS